MGSSIEPGGLSARSRRDPAIRQARRSPTPVLTPSTTASRHTRVSLIDREALRRGGVVGVVSYVREPAGIESVIPQTPTRDLHPAVRVLRTPPHRRLDPLAGV